MSITVPATAQNGTRGEDNKVLPQNPYPFLISYIMDGRRVIIGDGNNPALSEMRRPCYFGIKYGCRSE